MLYTALSRMNNANSDSTGPPTIYTSTDTNAAMVADASFEGWVGLDAESAQGKMVWQGYKPKTFEETDVDIEVGHPETVRPSR